MFAPCAVLPSPRPLRIVLSTLILAGALAGLAGTATAQVTPSGQVPPAAPVETPRAQDEATIAALAEAQAQPGTPASLVYANRRILELRAIVLGRAPADRVAAGRRLLDQLVDAGTTSPIETVPVGPGVALHVAGRRIIIIMPADVDALAGETPAAVASDAARRLEVAFDELAELRRPREMAMAALETLLATVILVGLVWLLRRMHAAASRRITEGAERRLREAKVGTSEFIRSSRIIEGVQRVLRVVMWAPWFILGYFWLTFVLRRFPYTRPWGEALRGFLLDQLSRVGIAILESLPGMFTVFVIVALTKFSTRIVYLFFQAVGEERVTATWLYPETAEPTRKLVTVGMWLFAVALSYPYLPGSSSDAFKGVSVFVGLVVSLGSTGIVNQVMSGLTLTYSRALRVGDFVAVGDVEGTVAQVGTLSTKIKTLRSEDVTIPNALMVSQTVTNYSRYADSEGVLVPTEVTIGYDVPWRQVEALLLMAAARSSGVRRDPAPKVLQAELHDFYVRYRLLFCPERPAERRKVLAIVHANILDAFNEYGVQITSPSYESDPAERKVVPRERWFAAPAAPPDTTS